MEKGEGQSQHFTACGLPDAILHHYVATFPLLGVILEGACPFLTYLMSEVSVGSYPYFLGF